jgi:hypothetical protein
VETAASARTLRPRTPNASGARLAAFMLRRTEQGLIVAVPGTTVDALMPRSTVTSRSDTWHLLAPRRAAADIFFHVYRNMLAMELPGLDGMVRVKCPVRLPVVLTRDEVRALVARLDGTPRLTA